jgi:hypothetical protein
MPIYARKKEREYSPAPEGLNSAVCCDVIDLGLIETGFGKQEKIEIRWQLEEIDPKSHKRYLVPQRYTPSLHEKSKLRPLLESWRGKKFSKEELKRFDIEKLIGANCQLSIVHNIKDEGEVYANVQAIVPPARNAGKLYVDEDYVRVQDRPGYVPPMHEPEAYDKPNGAIQQEEVGEDYVPF